MPTSTHELLGRDRAVQKIARHIADRDAYLVTIPPDTLPRLSKSLDRIATWSAYLDSGNPFILRTNRPGALLVTDLLIETAGVLVVPKTVPASALSKVVGQEVPADGSQDLVVLMPTAGPIFWPLLFVDALEIVDPKVAAQLRANHLPNLN